MITTEEIINGITVRTITYEDSDKATEEQKGAWMLMCNACEFKNNESCDYAFCGCLIEKLMIMADSKCPLNKW